MIKWPSPRRKVHPTSNYEGSKLKKVAARVLNVGRRIDHGDSTPFLSGQIVLSYPVSRVATCSLSTHPDAASHLSHTSRPPFDSTTTLSPASLSNLSCARQSALSLWRPLPIKSFEALYARYLCRTSLDGNRPNVQNLATLECERTYSDTSPVLPELTLPFCKRSSISFPWNHLSIHADNFGHQMSRCHTD